jgi:hypothetical protein
LRSVYLPFVRTPNVCLFTWGSSQQITENRQHLYF